MRIERVNHSSSLIIKQEEIEALKHENYKVATRSQRFQMKSEEIFNQIHHLLSTNSPTTAMENADVMNFEYLSSGLQTMEKLIEHLKNENWKLHEERKSNPSSVNDKSSN